MIETWIIILGVAALVAVGMMFYLLFSKSKQDLDNYPICINLMSSYSNGRMIGIETDRSIGKNGRIHVEYVPKDVDLKRLKGKLKNEKIIVPPTHVISLAKNTASKDRDVHIYMPTEISDLPQNLRDTAFGKMIEYAIQLKNTEHTVLKMLEEGNIRTSEILTKIGNGEATREMFKSMEASANDFLKMTVLAKDKEKSGFTPPTKT